MKILNYIFAAGAKVCAMVLCAMMFGGCEETGMPFDASQYSFRPHYLYLEESEYTTSTNAVQSIGLAVKAYSDQGWQFDNIPDWITVTPSSGTGSAAVTAKLAENSQLTSRTAILSLKSSDSDWGYSTPFTITQERATAPNYEYVDLGLSVKWATCNVGASSPEGYGDYFAWGATEPYYESGYAQSDSPVWKSGKSAGYKWSSYKYCNGSYTTMTKYCNNSSYGYNGYTDSKTVLDAEDDAATANWGGTWRMPTDAEQDELRNSANCEWTWYSSGNSEYNGVAGYKVTSKKSGYTGRSVFLPASGYRWYTNLSNVGSCGYYWSSSLSTDSPCNACNLIFDSGGYYWYDSSRYCGFAVRPVCQ